MKFNLYLSFVAVIAMAYSCNSDESVTSVNSFFNLTDEESLFISAKNANHKINESQALQIANQSCLSCITRSGNYNSQNLTPLTKNHFGVSDSPEYKIFSDTIVYLCDDENGNCCLISADNRVMQKNMGIISRELLFPQSNDNVSLALSDFFRESVLQKMKSEITRYEELKDSMDNIISSKLSSFIENHNMDVVTRANVNPDIVFNPNDYEVEILDEVQSPWQTVTDISPMLQVAWGQSYPYNDYVRDTIQCNNYHGVLTGCVATATAMLLSYWKCPTTLNGLNLDWDDIVSYDYPRSSNARHQVRTIMKTIGVECNATYECEGTTISMNNAKVWLLSHGFTGGDRVSYNISDILSSLTARRPILISGKTVSGEGHLWIIDGAIVEKRIVHRYYVYTNWRTGDSFTVDGGIIEDYSRYFNNNYGNKNAISWLSSDFYTAMGSHFPIDVKIFKHFRPISQ